MLILDKQKIINILLRILKQYKKIIIVCSLSIYGVNPEVKKNSDLQVFTPMTDTIEHTTASGAASPVRVSEHSVASGEINPNITSPAGITMNQSVSPCASPSSTQPLPNTLEIMQPLPSAVLPEGSAVCNRRDMDGVKCVQPDGTISSVKPVALDIGTEDNNPLSPGVKDSTQLTYESSFEYNKNIFSVNVVSQPSLYSTSNSSAPLSINSEYCVGSQANVASSSHAQASRVAPLPNSSASLPIRREYASSSTWHMCQVPNVSPPVQQTKTWYDMPNDYKFYYRSTHWHSLNVYDQAEMMRSRPTIHITKPTDTLQIFTKDIITLDFLLHPKINRIIDSLCDSSERIENEIGSIFSFIISFVHAEYMMISGLSAPAHVLLNDVGIRLCPVLMPILAQIDDCNALFRVME